MIIKNEIILKSQQRFISETLSSNNDKICKPLIELHGSIVGKVCKTELLEHLNI